MDPLQQSAAMNMALQYQAMLGLPPLTNVGAQLTMTPAGTAAQPVIVDRMLDPQAEIVDEFNKIAQEGVQEAVSDEVFSHYQHREIIPGALPHPGDIVEAGSLAALLPPPPTYPLSDSLPEEAITSGKLSSLQLEGVIYACQRHQLLLPNGTRAGFFIGDGAGVGKGRQISGIILDNFARGRTKHVWFSISTDLIVDARRDLTDIGCHVKVIEGCQQLDKESRVFGLPADFKEGVIFSTYATLVSAVQKGGSLSGSKQSRLQQLIDWCGGAEFDGCLVFDECHKAKNFVPNKEQASTKVALAVTSIQRLLPKARVVYCSATGVTDVKNMAFMERLGLWGEGAPFKSFDQFLETVQRKGLGVAEMLAMEMKTSGMYVSRGLSFKQAEFVTIEVPLTEVQTKIYDTAAHVWNELRKALESAINRTNTTNTRIWSSFWGVHQRFFKQLCLGMKVPAIIKETKQALEDGYSVVIGLQTTGEASLESEMGKNGSAQTGWVSLCKEIYSRFVRQHFPTMVDKPHSTTGPEEDPWSAQAKNMLLEFADKIHLPNSPLDEIIHQLGGPEKVAEMTGRRGRMVCTSSDTQPHYQLRDSDSAGCLDSLNVRERNHFMEGRKLVAIISDAASTGISLHADQRAANQRRRIHLTVELPWSADKAVQQLGRSHRSNQSSGPIYKLLTTNLGGERRFAAAVARRLQSLGALTKGDRRAATGADLTEFNFDTPYGRSALRTMYNAVCQSTIVAGVEFSSINMGKYQLDQLNTELAECLLLMGVLDQDVLRSSVKVKDADCRDVGKFLNRILGMSVKRQNLIFNYFCQALKAHVSRAKKEGSYNEGLVDIMATKVEMVREPREVFKEAATHNNTTNHLVLSIDRGMSWDMAVTRSENYSSPDDGFYCSRRDVRGKKLYILATQKEGSSHQFRIARPNTGVSMFEEERGDLMQKYVKVTAEKAEAGWKDQYETSKNLCMHGPHCKNGPSCKVGTRCYKMHLLCGGIVTLMSLLDTTIAKYAAGLQLSKADCTLRVVRVQLTNGERVVGIRYPEILIPQVEKDLKEQKTIEFFMQQQKNQATPGVVVPGPSMNSQDPVIHSLKYKTEDCTPVNPRCRKKALTPPVTMKNFFKPIAKKSASVNSTASQNQTGKKDNQDKNGISGKSLDLKSSEKSGAASKRSLGASSADVSDRISSAETNGTETEVDRLKAETLAGDKQDDSDDFVTFSSQRNKSKSQGSMNFGNSMPSAPKSGQKRPPPKSKDGPKTKKPKQTSILASLGKKKSMKEETEVTERKCPVCQKVFPRGLFNEDVNKHIDNCLIE